MTIAEPAPFITFTVTPEDYGNALQLHMRRHWITRAGPKLIVLAVIIAAVIAVVVSGFDPVLIWIAVLWVATFLFMPLFAYFFVLPRRARKIHSQQKTLHDPVKASWTKDSYTAASDKIAGTLAWTDYYGWSADDRIILLMQSPVMFQMIPRHGLNEDQAASLLDTIERSGLRKI